MLSASRRALLIYSLVLVALIFLLSRLQTPQRRVPAFSSNVLSTTTTTPLPRLSGPLSPAVYTLFEQAYSNAFPPPLELDEIARACAASTYKPNIYLQCELTVGGITTLYSHIKTCLNIAFWMGTNIVIPTTPLRGDDPKEFDWVAHIPLGKWIDRDFLIDRIHQACPQIQFALLDEKKEPSIEVSKTFEIDTKGEIFDSPLGPYAANDDERAWKPVFERKIAAIQDEKIEGNVIIKTLARAMFFNITSSTHVQHAFSEMSHLLRTTPRIRDAIAQIIPLITSKYIGVHFRAEKDVVGDSMWKSAQVQLSRTFEIAERAAARYNLDRVIYLACGDKEAVLQFTTYANSLNWQVIDKWSLATPTLLKTIEDLDFDHEAMIDFAVLLVSHFFIGTGVSAFSFSIAHDRAPTGRFSGNSLDGNNDLARTHLFECEGGLYLCCL